MSKQIISGGQYSSEFVYPIVTDYFDSNDNFVRLKIAYNSLKKSILSENEERIKNLNNKLGYIKYGDINSFDIPKTNVKLPIINIKPPLLISTISTIKNEPIPTINNEPIPTINNEPMIQTINNEPMIQTINNEPIPTIKNEPIQIINNEPIPTIKYVELKYLIFNYNNFMNIIVDIYNSINNDYNKGFGWDSPKLKYELLVVDETYVPYYSFIDNFHKLLIKNANELYNALLLLLNIPNFKIKKCK